MKDHISVCVPTFRRNEMLKRLLRSLALQENGGLFKYSVVVVDNDAAGTARETVMQLMAESGLDITYFIEPEQNISLARNKALGNAKGNYIAFIDDDEIPNNNWLMILYKACLELEADGIQGPVIPLFENKAPLWVIKGGFYKRPDYPTGMVIKWRQGRTGNLLLKRKLIEQKGIIFDPAFGSGGEDQDFFRRMIGKGYVFKYCREAVAYEYIPSIRWKRTFLLKRALLRGKVTVSNPTFNILSILKSMLAVPIYTVSLPILFFMGHHLFMKYLVKDFDHIGKILTFLKIDVIKKRYILR